MIYNVHIWNVSLNLIGCGATCQIWLWFTWYNRDPGKIRNIPNKRINELSISNPSPYNVVMSYSSYVKATGQVRITGTL